MNFNVFVFSFSEFTIYNNVLIKLRLLNKAGTAWVGFLLLFFILADKRPTALERLSVLLVTVSVDEAFNDFWLLKILIIESL